MHSTMRRRVGCLLAALVLAGCAGPVQTAPSRTVSGTTRSEHAFGAVSVRRTVDQSYLNSPDFGAPRGRRFEDLVPIGSRVSAVHAAIRDGAVQAIWLSYEGNGRERQTLRRGARDGAAETFKLKANEKIVGIHAYGGGSIEALTIATNLRNHTFGTITTAAASAQTPWFDELTDEQRDRYVGIGLTGRADEVLRQVTLRIQVQGDAVAGVN